MKNQLEQSVRDRPVAEQTIEITPEMIEAGVGSYYEMAFRLDEAQTEADARDLVVNVFRKMQLAAIHKLRGD